MTEFLIGLLLTLATLTGAAGLFQAEWERTRCAYLTFEAAHTRLTGGWRKPDLRIQVEVNAEGVRAIGRCGKAREEVDLPWLDGAP